MLRHTVIVPVAAAAIAAASMSVAPAASTVRAADAVWGTPTVISAPGARGRGPDVAVDAAGNTTAVWTQGRDVVAARRPAGGRWQAPVTIGWGRFTVPQVAADDRGDVTVVWEGGPRWRIMTARRPAYGHWSEPVALSEPGGGFEELTAQAPELAVSRGGAAVVSWWYAVWPDEEVFPGRVEAAYRPARGRWSAPHVVARGVREPATVGIDTRGTVTAVLLGAGDRVRAVRRVVGHGWRPSVRLSGPRPLRGWVGLAVAVDGRGDATAVWRVSDVDTGATTALRTASRPLGHRWSSPAPLLRVRGDVEVDWGLAMDDTGTAVLATAPLGRAVSVRSRPLHGRWGPPEVIAPSGAGWAGVVVDPRGDALVSWTQGHWNQFEDLTRYAAYRPRGGTWGEPQQVAGVESAAFALHRDGGAVAVWGPPGAPGRIRARTMTASP